MSGSHWKSATDPRTGRTYYYHEITRETQWRKPIELASNAERKAMEEKEKKQKDFFAAMEANILNSLSQGQVPGTPKTAEIQRRKLSRKLAERPELVRTISTMNSMVLRNLIQRQPSYRNVNQGLSRGDSLDPREFQAATQRSSHIASSEFESFVSLIGGEKERLDPLHESSPCNDDSIPDLSSYFPDEDDYGDDSFGDSSVNTDGSKFGNTVSGSGLTWDETQAMKKLATITKEMIHAEQEAEDYEDGKEEKDAEYGKKLGLAPSLISNQSKGTRDLPREIELDDSDDDEESTSRGSLTDIDNSAFQKAKDIGGRELDFDSDEDDTESDLAPTPVKPRAVLKIQKSPKKEENLDSRPEVRRRNTCSTLYVGTTMSAPDKDANIKCVCGVLRTHILSSEQLPCDDSDIEFCLFNDHESDQEARTFKFHNQHKNRPPVPSLEEVTRFYRDIFYKAQMESDCIIMSLIYVERLVKKTGGKLRPRAENWRSLLFSCMILSSKVWDDLSMWNVDFGQSCPPGVNFPLQRINELELAVLNALSFQVKVPASEYAKYYFLLRSMLIKSGLGGENLLAMDPLDVMAAKQLQQVSSQFENLKLGSKSDVEQKRSQSFSIPGINSKQRAGTKLGLEHVVKM